MWLGQTETKPA